MTHTRAFHTPDVSSSTESGNPRIWNPTTVAILGMIGTLSEHKPVLVCCTALKTALSGLRRVVFCNSRDSDVGIIAEFRITYGTVPERIRQRRFAFGKIWTQSGLSRQQTAMKHFSRSCPFITTASTGHLQTTQDIVPIVIRLDQIGGVSRMLRDAPNSRECSADLSGPFPTRRTLLLRLCSANGRTFQIIEGSNRLFHCSCRSAV